MLTKRIVFFGQDATVGCDGRCNKAWGINGRPRKLLGRDPDDYVYRADDELDVAPPPGKTVIITEGSDTKPSATALDDKSGELLNRWCVRECERSGLTEPGHPDEPPRLPDLQRPKPN